MAKIILHIGTEKTGTTAIQECIHANRDLLLSQLGIFVPFAYSRYQNHRCFMEIVPTLNVPQDDLYNELAESVGASFDARSQRDSWLRSFENDAEEFSDKCFLLSSEHFHSRLDTQDSIVKFLQFLSAYFSEIRVVIFLRDPFYCAAALRSTLVVNGHCVPDPLEPENERVRLLCDHATSLQRWSSSLQLAGFDPSSLEPHLYAPEEFPHRCAARNFLRLLGVENPDQFKFPTRKVNESLGPRELELLNHFNRLTPSAGEHINISEILSLLSRIKSETRSSVQRSAAQDPALMARFDAFYRASNEWVHHHFFSGRPVLFEAAPSESRAKLDLSDEVFHSLSTFQTRSRILGRLRELTDNYS